MGEAFLITSGKGGVGKTTFAAHIGAALVRRGKKVLLIDANFGLRNLDIALGLSSEIVYDIYDVTQGLCTVQQAIVAHAQYAQLHMIAAPQGVQKKVNAEKLKQFVQMIKEEYDFVFLDGAAGVGSAFCAGAMACDKAIIVTTATLYSLRDGEQASIGLEHCGVKDFCMVVNRVDPKLMKKKGAINVDDLIDGVRVRLLGIVLEDKQLSRDMALEKPAFLDYYVKANTCFYNIAARLLGETVPIMRL